MMNFNYIQRFFYIGILLAFLFSCTTSQSILLVTESYEIEISGQIQNLPKELQVTDLSLEVRFYSCPSLDFGKYNSDTGTYPFQKNDCRLKYSQKDYSLNRLKFSLNVNPLINWTHGSIELKGIQKVRGKFSAGENPFWFTKQESSSKKIEITYEFRSTENPIPDKIQTRLAEKFAPIIVLKKNKKFIPTNLAKYYKSHKIKSSQKKFDSILYGHDYALKDEYLELDESLYGIGVTHLYYHVRYAKTFVSGTTKKALPGWRDNFNYYYERGNGDVVISYYLWYDFNEGPSPMGNQHEGDFESFAVLIDKNENPLRFMATGHNHVMLDTSWNNINSYNHHPIIYIAHGRNSDGGNPTSPYGGYEVSLEAGNFLFNLIANPKDIFPEITEDAQIILPKDLEPNDLKNLRIGPGEWIDRKKTRYVDASKLVTKKIERLVRWEEPGWINQSPVSNPNKTYFVKAEDSFFMNWNGRIGRHPESKINFLQLTQYGKSPVNPPFKMNEEQHFTFEKPSHDRCEKGRIGDYCPKFIGDEKTPQFSK